MSLDAAIKLSQETKTTILKTVSGYPGDISADTASALIACISEDLEMFSPECRQTLIDSINSKTSRSDMGCSDNSDEQPAAASTVLAGRRKQSLYHIENYLTHAIWKRLRAVPVNREVVYLEIAKLLVQLGLHRLKEKFWGHLFALYNGLPKLPWIILITTEIC